MSFVGAAIAFSAVASIASGFVQASAAKSAAKANERVQREAIASNEREKVTIREENAASIDLGRRAELTLTGEATDEERLDSDFSSERDDFLVSEATRSINRQLSASGQSLSGAALEAIGRETTDIRTAGTQRVTDILENQAGRGVQGRGIVAGGVVPLQEANAAALGNIGAQNAQSKLDQGSAIGGGLEGAGQAVLTGAIVNKAFGGGTNDTTEGFLSDGVSLGGGR